MSSPRIRAVDNAPRLPPDTHLGRVQLRVADLTRALDFYTGRLGLQLLRSEGRTSVLGPEGSGRELIVLEEKPGISRRPMRPRTAGLYHVALLLPSRRDLGRTLIALSESGYPLRGTSDHAVSESLYLDDPDGNGLEIYADRPREEWPVVGGIIQMTVEPMDVAGVLAAGQENPQPWTGLPGGTVVGHIHLTVSTMERALAFYHEVIGFDLMMRIPSLTAVSAGGYHHHLNLNTWAGEGAPPDSEAVAGLDWWELRVPEGELRQALVDRVGRAGRLTTTSPMPTAKDPDDNLIRIPFN
jgi:catechol 2,3-dioxygenase